MQTKNNITNVFHELETTNERVETLVSNNRNTGLYNLKCTTKNNLHVQKITLSYLQIQDECHIFKMNVYIIFEKKSVLERERIRSNQAGRLYILIKKQN